MTFEEALAYLYSANDLGSRLGLDRMQKAMQVLGQPKMPTRLYMWQVRTGSGSTSSFLAHIAAAQDLKVGWHTSPI